MAQIESSYVNMPVAQLVKALCDHAQVGSSLHSEITGALAVRLTSDLTEAINRHEKAASRLSNQLLVLNIVLGIFTVAGTVLAVMAFVR